MLTNYICALDIGSSKISASLAQIKNRRIHNIYFQTAPVKGVKGGAITDSIEIGEVISKILKSLRSKSGINVKFVYAGISGEGIVTKHSRAIIPLAERGNKVITSNDIHRVCDQALILGSSIEEEILHHIPYGYAIDSNDNIANPVDLYSHKLEVDLFLICVNLSYLQTLTHIVNQAGFELRDVFFSGLASSCVVFGPGMQKGINLLCDIGSDTTELLIFKEGLLKNIEILPLGGRSFTLALADNLKIPWELAEEIKRSYGVIGDANSIAADKEILFKKDQAFQPIKQSLVCEIITSQARSISKAIKEVLDKYVSAREVRNFFLTGNTILQEGFLEMLESVCGMPVEFGRIADPDLMQNTAGIDVLSGRKYLTYLASLGIIAQAMQERKPRNIQSLPHTHNLFVNTLRKIQEIYREYF
jgi:cell division protein FtsA